jgi:hypothetical protein
MARKYGGKIALDIRDSVPDWEPYLPAKAPEGAPNVLLIAWDGVGFATMAPHGGPVETPTTQPSPTWACATRTSIRRAGNAYLSGATGSSDFPTTAHSAWSTAYSAKSISSAVSCSARSARRGDCASRCRGRGNGALSTTVIREARAE